VRMGFVRTSFPFFNPTPAFSLPLDLFFFSSEMIFESFPHRQRRFRPTFFIISPAQPRVFLWVGDRVPKLTHLSEPSPLHFLFSRLTFIDFKDLERCASWSLSPPSPVLPYTAPSSETRPVIEADHDFRSLCLRSDVPVFLLFWR